MSEWVNEAACSSCCCDLWQSHKYILYDTNISEFVKFSRTCQHNGCSKFDMIWLADGAIYINAWASKYYLPLLLLSPDIINDTSYLR